MNANNEIGVTKQPIHFLLSKKRKNPEPIFEIKKIKKLKILEKLEDTEETGTETQTCFSPSNKSISPISLNEMIIPSFFNDKIMNSNFKQKLQKYDQVTKEFDDMEDREIYLVRKESLFSEQTCVSLNDSFDSKCY